MRNGVDLCVCVRISSMINLLGLISYVVNVADIAYEEIALTLIILS